MGLTYIAKQHYKRGVTSLHFMETEPITFTMGGLGFRIFSPFIDNFNAKMEQMLSSGIIQKFVEDQSKPRIDKIDGVAAQVLTMSDLSVAFQICCIPLVLSLIVFAGELAVFYLKYSLVFARERMIANAIIRAYYAD